MVSDTVGPNSVESIAYARLPDGVQFCSLGEIFPNHIRAKGVVVGVATICAINIVWLQVAPIAFRTIGYKFYLVFCIPGFIAATWLWFFFPNTLGLPLEEVARLFGDADELYQAAHLGPTTTLEKTDSGSQQGAYVSTKHVEEA